MKIHPPSKRLRERMEKLKRLPHRTFTAEQARAQVREHLSESSSPSTPPGHELKP